VIVLAVSAYAPRTKVAFILEVIRAVYTFALAKVWERHRAKFTVVPANLKVGIIYFCCSIHAFSFLSLDFFVFY
jgi:uncharacterized membrane protein YgdD (TMEM256/DUF423 family)